MLPIWTGNKITLFTIIKLQPGFAAADSDWKRFQTFRGTFCLTKKNIYVYITAQWCLQEQERERAREIERSIQAQRQIWTCWNAGSSVRDSALPAVCQGLWVPYFKQSFELSWLVLRPKRYTWKGNRWIGAGVMRVQTPCWLIKENLYSYQTQSETCEADRNIKVQKKALIQISFCFYKYLPESISTFDSQSPHQAVEPLFPTTVILSPFAFPHPRNLGCTTSPC